MMKFNQGLICFIIKTSWHVQAFSKSFQTGLSFSNCFSKAYHFKVVFKRNLCFDVARYSQCFHKYSKKKTNLFLYYILHKTQQMESKFLSLCITWFGILKFVGNNTCKYKHKSLVSVSIEPYVSPTFGSQLKEVGMLPPILLFDAVIGLFVSEFDIKISWLSD